MPNQPVVHDDFHVNVVRRLGAAVENWASYALRIGVQVTYEADFVAIVQVDLDGPYPIESFDRQSSARCRFVTPISAALRTFVRNEAS